MSERNVRRSTQERRNIVYDFHHSRLSVRDYCKKNQLALAAFSKWKRYIALAESAAMSDNKPSINLSVVLSLLCHNRTLQ